MARKIKERLNRRSRIARRNGLIIGAMVGTAAAYLLLKRQQEERELLNPPIPQPITIQPDISGTHPPVRLSRPITKIYI